MKNFIYIGVLITYLMQQASLGSDEEESAWLRDPTFSYALTPVLSAKQITLTENDIINETSNSQNFQKVFFVELNYYDFNSANREKIFSYFNQNNLNNLRVIEVYQSVGVSNLIEELFGNSKPKNKYVSLFRINAAQSDITNQDLDKIYSYFSKCSYFIRDMMQISARYDVEAAFLSVNLRGVNNLTNIDSWQRGKKTSSSGLVFYRSSKEEGEGPFIMSIEH